MLITERQVYMQVQLVLLYAESQPAGKNHVMLQNFKNFESNTMLLLQNNSNEFETGPQRGWGADQRLLSAIFSKSIFLSSYA